MSINRHAICSGQQTIHTQYGCSDAQLKFQYIILCFVHRKRVNKMFFKRRPFLVAIIKDGDKIGYHQTGFKAILLFSTFFKDVEGSTQFITVKHEIDRIIFIKSTS